MTNKFLNNDFWDCECETNYIHSKNIKLCLNCNANQEEQPDSRQSEVETLKTPAQSLLFQLQFMGIMMLSGRQDEADAAYVKAQQLAQQLVDAGH